MIEHPYVRAAGRNRPHSARLFMFVNPMHRVEASEEKNKKRLSAGRYGCEKNKRTAADPNFSAALFRRYRHTRPFRATATMARSRH